MAKLGVNIKLTTLCLGGFFALTSFVARPILADEGNKKTEFQFSAPVQIPGKTLAAGSGSGQAITYMVKHWEKVTLFLRQAGAPLDSNIVERALKKAILHRKNALFHKTRNGTAEVARDPGRWMPWNYRATLEEAVASKAA